MSASLSVSIVTYAPDLAVVEETARTLNASLLHAIEAGSLSTAEVTLIDNGPGTRYEPALKELATTAFRGPVPWKLLSGHGNVGYGRANNLALLASTAEYHLVLNPDVALEREAIDTALRYMVAYRDVVILAPAAFDPSGAPLHLCKRYPSVLDLVLRGFAPAPLRAMFERRLERYEMRDLPRDRPTTGIPLLSGSFLFCRREAIATIGGFDDAYFLYFEDFDLCLRAARAGRLAFVPAVRIAHRGGHAARKGWRHIQLFVRSAIKFFNRHGWNWA